MSIGEFLKKYPKIETELLLAHVLRKPKEFVFINGNYKLTRIQADKLSQMIKRRMRGEPIAYLLGYKDFYGLRFKVNKDVLIPRPETEWVVEKISNFQFPISNAQIKILDVGTGSGCIIISIAKNLQHTTYNIQLYGSDISKKALSIAKSNAVKHKVKIKFIQSNLLKTIKFDPDIIVANLPYGWKQWKNNTSAATVGLKFEPRQALFTKEHGLYFYRKLLEQIKIRNNKPKLIYLEFDPRQKPKLHQLIKKYLPGWKVEFYKDFNGLWRYAVVKG